MWLKVRCVGGKTIKVSLTKKQDTGYPWQQEGNPCQGRAQETSEGHSQLSRNNCSGLQALAYLSSILKCHLIIQRPGGAEPRSRCQEAWSLGEVHPSRAV